MCKIHLSALHDRTNSQLLSVKSSELALWDTALQFLETLIWTWSSTQEVSTCMLNSKNIITWGFCRQLTPKILTDLDPHKVLEQGYDYWLEKLEKFLKRSSDVQFKNRTPHSVQFRYKELIDVDMLVTPWWDSVSQLSLFLDKIPVQKRFPWVKI